MQNIRIKLKFKCSKFYKQIWNAVDDMVIIESNVYNKTHDTKFNIQLPMMDIKNNLENDLKYAKYKR
jgi:hypothetical protein